MDLNTQKLRVNRPVSNKIKKQEKDIYYQEQINSLGFTGENNFLVENGYIKVRKNLKLLQKFNGDLNLALDKFLLKAQNKEERKGGKFKFKYREKAVDNVHKQDRKENEEINQQISENLIQSLNGVEVDTYYLDGNNMLFCDKEIRNMCLNKQRKQAEMKFAELVQSKFTQVSNVKLVYLIFDQSQLNVDSQNFIVTSARPQFQSSDDALVQIALQHSNLDKCLFITSDRELLRRLREAGVTKFMKSNQLVQQVVQQ